MDAIRTFRKNHPVIFSIIAVAICVIIGLHVFGFIYNHTIYYLVDSARMNEGTSTIFADCIITIAAIAILVITGRSAIITRKGQGFFRGLFVALPVLCYQIFSIYYMVSVADAILSGDAPAQYGEIVAAMGQPLFDTASIVVILSYLMVGLAEELVCRGIVGQTLLERFGTDRANIWKALIISSVIFGVVHGQNIISGSDAMATAIQVFQTIFAGLFLGAVYFRTGNIWVVALLHGLNDVMASTSSWLFQSAAESGVGAVAAASLSPTMLTLPLIYLCLTLFLMRKSKLGDVQKNWEPELSTWQAEKDAA